MDKKYKNLSNRKDEKRSFPPNGYFNAKIVCTADTPKETNKFLNSLGMPLQKWSVERSSKASAIKLISSAASSVIRSSICENSLVFTDDDDDTDADETVEPVRSYKEKLQGKESINAKLEEENEMLKSELMLIKEQLKKAEEETKSVSEKLIHTKKKKYNDLKPEFKIARHLNYELQKKLIGSTNVIVCPDESNHSLTSAQEPLSPSIISENVFHLPKRKRPTTDIVDQSPKMSKLNCIDNMVVDETQAIFPASATVESVTNLFDRDEQLFVK